MDFIDPFYLWTPKTQNFLMKLEMLKVLFNFYNAFKIFVDPRRFLSVNGQKVLFVEEFWVDLRFRV